MDSTPALAHAAVLLGVLHTLIGPDHYVPFLALARGRGWTLRRTLAIATLCGIGHVLGSVVIGALGIGLGWALGSMEALEAARGRFAGWLLLGLGLAYTAWGLHRAFRARGHVHVGAGGHARFHAHGHGGAHDHPQGGRGGPERGRLTPWILFLVFVLGPCEVLIPLLLIPAATHDVGTVALVAALFGIATVATMLACVAVGYAGLMRLPSLRAGRWAHALGGLVLAACGVAVLA